jgi:hypothetical protein
MVDVAAVPITTTVVLFGTGIALLMAVWRQKGTTAPMRNASPLREA